MSGGAPESYGDGGVRIGEPDVGVEHVDGAVEDVGPGQDRLDEIHMTEGVLDLLNQIRAH